MSTPKVIELTLKEPTSDSGLVAESKTAFLQKIQALSDEELEELALITCMPLEILVRWRQNNTMNDFKLIPSISTAIEFMKYRNKK